MFNDSSSAVIVCRLTSLGWILTIESPALTHQKVMEHLDKSTFPKIQTLAWLYWRPCWHHCGPCTHRNTRIWKNAADQLCGLKSAHTLCARATICLLAEQAVVWVSDYWHERYHWCQYLLPGTRASSDVSVCFLAKEPSVVSASAAWH